MSDAGKDPEVKVQDRRRFESDGSPREGADEASTDGETRELPAIDFSTFVISLSSSAMLNMGVDPATGEATGEKQLDMAQQTIDILGMLKAKTEGNLTDTEGKLLDELLYNLRMAFLQYCQ